MKHMSIPSYLWGETIRHTTYFLNRIATRALKDRTPYELYHDRKPNISHLRIFGCIGYASVESKFLKKLADRSRMLVYLGTEPGSKAYRLFDPQTRRIIVSRDVVFDESKSWNWESGSSEHDKYFQIKIGVFGTKLVNRITSTYRLLHYVYTFVLHTIVLTFLT